MSTPPPIAPPTSTEDISPRYAGLDTWPTAALADALWESQMAAVAAVRPALEALAAAVDAAAARLGATGRIVYVGAGTSGRIGVQDGSELPPTFSWPTERVTFLMAGGPTALLRAIEGAEDDARDGARQIDGLKAGSADVVIGVAASGTTPFTVAAVKRARERGALTIGIAANRAAPLALAAEHAIVTETGAEPIAGSTRMKAGTAHKVVLNLFSTALMVRLGRVYDGIMVDMKATNVKLKARAERIVAHIAGCDPATARHALAAADGDMKLASLMALGIDERSAAAGLDEAGGNLRRALDAVRPRRR